MDGRESLKEWLDGHYIKYSLRKDILVIPGFGRFLIQDDYEHIFRERKEIGGDTSVVFNAQENYTFLRNDDIMYIAFPFGSRWYYVGIDDDPEEQQFRELKYIGEKPVFEHGIDDYYPLGIHTGFELLNGCGLLDGWCRKANFLGYKGLGIADRNTMAATLALQTSASAAGLKYCFGYSLTVDMGDSKVDGIVYCNTQKGFRNMLRIQKAVAVDSPDKAVQKAAAAADKGVKEIPADVKEIDALTLFSLAEGNVFVFGKGEGEWMRDNMQLVDDFCNAFSGWVYFQVDCSEYKADRIDSAVLLSMKAFFDTYYIDGVEYAHDVRPILIQDVYYPDREDSGTKTVLNKVDTGVAHAQSDQQWMKTPDELYADWRAVFSDRYSDDVFYDMLASTADIVENAEAAYDLSENYAPRYDMTDEEREKYGSTHNMFNELIEDGFRVLVPQGEEDKYRERVEYEKYVIESTDNVDYFLIQREEINWAQQRGILTGVGRGSAGGSLVLYLLGITYIDPLKYDLIFERFLLPERAGLEPADVTMMCEGVDSDEWVEIELDNGKAYRFDKDSEFLVKRGDETVRVFADELRDGDDIVWDRRDELFTLEETGDDDALQGASEQTNNVKR